MLSMLLLIEISCRVCRSFQAFKINETGIGISDIKQNKQKTMLSKKVLNTFHICMQVLNNPKPLKRATSKYFHKACAFNWVSTATSKIVPIHVFKFHFNLDRRLGCLLKTYLSCTGLATLRSYSLRQQSVVII